MVWTSSYGYINPFSKRFDNLSVCRIMNSSILGLNKILRDEKMKDEERRALDIFLEKFEPVGNKILNVSKHFSDWGDYCCLYAEYTLSEYSSNEKTTYLNLRSAIKTIKNVQKGVIEPNAINKTCNFLDKFAEFTLHLPLGGNVDYLIAA